MNSPWWFLFVEKTCIGNILCKGCQVQPGRLFSSLAQSIVFPDDRTTYFEQSSLLQICPGKKAGPKVR